MSEPSSRGWNSTATALRWALRENARGIGCRRARVCRVALHLVSASSPAHSSAAPLARKPSFKSLDWDFRSACFFAVTVMTSVGYGSFAPQTPGGRIFTVAFAIVMLPFFAYALSLISGYVVTALAVMAKKLTRGEDKPEVVLAVSVLVTFLW